MASLLKLFLTALLITLSLCMASARPLTSGPTLATRLHADQSGSNCWDTLFQLQSCTGEIITFFLNGETYLGSECCRAIRTVEHGCWTGMFDTLGFTQEEGNVLQGYCDDQENDDDNIVHARSPPSATAPGLHNFTVSRNAVP